MKVLILVLFLQIFAIQAFAAKKMKCTVSDKKSSVRLLPPSAEETYMNEGRFRDLEISALENSAGDTYSVFVTKNKALLVSTTIPFYEDANLKFKYKNNLITVICLR